MRLLALPAILAVAACAQSPDAIAPVAMPGGMYDHLSCQDAQAERAALFAAQRPRGWHDHR